MTWNWRKALLPACILFAAVSAMAASQVLHGTYISKAETVVAIPASTMTALGSPVTVNCPGTTGTCTIDADMWVQNGGASTTGNQFEICLFVDGVIANTQCEGYAGVTPSDGTYLLGSTSQSLSGLALGTHTAQTYFWSRNGCTAFYGKFNYRVYKP